MRNAVPVRDLPAQPNTDHAKVGASPDLAEERKKENRRTLAAKLASQPKNS